MGFGDKLKGLKDQAQQAVAENKDKIQGAVQVVGDAANTKTHGKYATKIMKVGEKVEAHVDKFADGGADAPADGGADAPDQPAAAAPVAPDTAGSVADAPAAAAPVADASAAAAPVACRRSPVALLPPQPRSRTLPTPPSASKVTPRRRNAPTPRSPRSRPAP